MSHASPAEAGERVWRSSEPWLETTRRSATAPGVLLSELADWAALLDRHSSVRVDRAVGGALCVVWENAAGLEPHARECAFRLGAIAGLLGASAEVRHAQCRARGHDVCAFHLKGIEPAPDADHANLLREVALVSVALQGRESLFRRMSLLGAPGEPFPDVRDLRGVRRLLEELEDPVLVLDRGLGILDANRAATVVMGMSLDELRGLALRDLFPPESQARIQELPQLLQHGPVRGLSVEARTRRGSVPLEISARGSESGVTLVLIARDVSEHRRLERELEARNRELRDQNRRIGESDQLKSEFLANVSHELTTPLTSIKGFARLLAGDFTGEAAGAEPRLSLDKRTEFISIVQREAERMADLIRGLLELSKIESGVVALDRARVSPGAIVRECLLLLKPRLDDRGVSVALELAEDRSAHLDPDRIKQVILNLIDNAIKFSEPGSTIGISTSGSGDAVRLSIRNPAPTLEQADLDRMFQRFVQKDGSFSRLHGGVGLGLSLVRSIVRLHGGRVWAELAQPGVLQVTVEIPR